MRRKEHLVHQNGDTTMPSFGDVDPWTAWAYKPRTISLLLIGACLLMWVPLSVSKFCCLSLNCCQMTIFSTYNQLRLAILDGKLWIFAFLNFYCSVRIIFLLVMIFLWNIWSSWMFLLTSSYLLGHLIIFSLKQLLD